MKIRNILSTKNGDPSVYTGIVSFSGFVGSLLLGMFLVGSSLTRTAAWSVFGLSLLTYVAVFFGIIPGIIAIYDYRTQHKTPYTALKACGKLSGLCYKLGLADHITQVRVASLASGIQKYGGLLLNQVTITRKMAEVCTDDDVKHTLIQMADSQTQSIYNIVAKFQKLVPAIIAGSHDIKLDDIATDLESLRCTIERTTNEVNGIVNKPVAALKTTANETCQSTYNTCRRGIYDERFRKG